MERSQLFLSYRLGIHLCRLFTFEISRELAPVFRNGHLFMPSILKLISIALQHHEIFFLFIYF